MKSVNEDKRKSTARRASWLAESRDALRGPGRTLGNLASGFSILDSSTLWGILAGGIVWGLGCLFVPSSVAIGAFTASGVAAGVLGARALSPERRRQRHLNHAREGMAIRQALEAQQSGRDSVQAAEDLVTIALREAAGTDVSELKEHFRRAEQVRLPASGT